MGFLELIQPAHAAAQDHAAAMGVFPVEVESRVAHREGRSHHRELREAVVPLLFLGIEERMRIEVLDFAGEVGLEARGVESLDGADAAAAVADRLPEAGQLATERRKRGHASHYRAPSWHPCSPAASLRRLPLAIPS